MANDRCWLTCKVLVVNIRSGASFDVFIGRPSQWGNPFTHLYQPGRSGLTVVGSRQEAIERYEEYLNSQPFLLEQIPDLRGKILGCYCKPEAYHGDVLARIANS